MLAERGAQRDTAGLWIDRSASGFGSITEDADFLTSQVSNPSYAVAETYWFQFMLPEQDLHGEIYVWVHPNLKTASAGCWIWRGFKRHHLQAEHFNFKNYLPYPTILGSRILLPEAGIEIHVIKPLNQIEVRYIDEATSTSVHLIQTACMAPVVRANSKHFDLPVWSEGELNLNGQRLALGGFGVRNRSWGEPRFERSINAPPLSWVTAVLGDGGTAFHFSGYDDPAKGARWAGAYDVAPELLRDGWIFRDGRLRSIRRMSKETQRDPHDNLSPVSLICELEDEDGVKHGITGTLKALIPFAPWSNIWATWGQAEWQLDDGQCGRGEYQEYCWDNFIRNFG